MSSSAQTQIPEKRLKLDAIEKLIAIKAPSLVLLIRKRGIDFPVDQSTLLRLEKLGASRAVMEALKDVQAPRDSQDKRVSIRVADFEPVGVQERPVTQILFEQLRNATKGYPDISSRLANLLPPNLAKTLPRRWEKSGALTSSSGAGTQEGKKRLL